jgi:hypothetical protein
MGQARQPVFEHADAHHGVQAQHCEIGEIVPGEAFAREVGVDATQPAESAATGAETPPIGQFDGSGVAHHDVLYVSPAIHKHADLAADFVADLAQLPGKFVAHEAIGGQAPLEKPVQLFNLAGFETAGIAENLDEDSPD